MDKKKEPILVFAPIHDTSNTRVWCKTVIPLAKAGHSVTLICSEDLRAHSNEGIRVIECKSSFSAPFRVFSWPKWYFMALRAGPKKCLVVNPHGLGVGLLLRLSGRKIIADIHEDYSGALLVRKWIPFPLRKAACFLYELFEGISALFLNRIIVTQKIQKDRIGPKATLIGNPPVMGLISEAIGQNRPKFDGQPWRIYFGGLLTKERKVEHILSSLVRLNVHQETELVMTGKWTDYMAEDLADHPGMRYVRYMGYLPVEDLYKTMATCQIGLLFMEDIGDRMRIDTTKLLEYCAVGLPFIVSDSPVWRSMVEPYSPGEFLREPNVGTITDAIEELLQDSVRWRHYSKQGRLAGTKHSWESIEKEFLRTIGAV